MSVARSSLAASVNARGNIYAIGGHTSSPETTPFTRTDAVEEYDPIADKWTTRTSLPTATMSLSAALGNNGKVHAIGGWTDTNAATNTNYAATEIDTRQLVSVHPARIWIGLKNSDDVGVRFDLLAEVYKNDTLVVSGHINGVPAGSSGFNNARLIPFHSAALPQSNSPSVQRSN